jgi:hypothetical protein
MFRREIDPADGRGVFVSVHHGTPATFS